MRYIDDRNKKKETTEKKGRTYEEVLPLHAAEERVHGEFP